MSWHGVGTLELAAIEGQRRWIERLENPPPVLSKRDFVERYRKGEFGNASPTWDTSCDFIRDEGGKKEDIFHPSRYHLRSRKAGGPTFYNLRYKVIIERWWHENREGTGGDWYASAMAPHDRGTIQGEVMRTPQGLYLYYASAKKPMREALAEGGREATGIIAVSLLREYLCPNSYEWLNVLLDRYPDHIVEFSSFEVEWGTLPGFNTVFWEVRNY